MYHCPKKGTFNTTGTADNRAESLPVRFHGRQGGLSPQGQSQRHCLLPRAGAPRPTLPNDGKRGISCMSKMEESEERMRFFDDEETELLVEMSHSIFRTLVQEVVLLL